MAEIRVHGNLSLSDAELGDPASRRAAGWACGCSPATGRRSTPPRPAASSIRAAHVTELRAAVLALE